MNIPCFRLMSEQDLNLIGLAAFRRVRMDLLWRKVEKQPIGDRRLLLTGKREYATV